MTISYNLNIPFATHNPSVDQPNMEANTNAIASFVAIDHVPFNTAGSGEHNQVTFAANNIPTTPTSPPVAFTNTVGSAPQLFFYSDSTFNQYVNGVSGSTYLLGGIILKWGTVTLPGTGFSQNVTYPVAFPNGAWAVNAIKSDTVSTATLNFVTNFAGVPNTFTANKSSSSQTLTITYIAIGY